MPLMQLIRGARGRARHATSGVQSAGEWGCYMCTWVHGDLIITVLVVLNRLLLSQWAVWIGGIVVSGKVESTPVAGIHGSGWWRTAEGNNAALPTPLH